MRVQRDLNSQRTGPVFPRLKKIGRRKIRSIVNIPDFRSDLGQKYLAKTSLPTFPRPALYPIDGLRHQIRRPEAQSPAHPSGSFFNKKCWYQAGP